MNVAASSLVSPMTSAPSIAPYGCPTPPRMAAATMTTRKLLAVDAEKLVVLMNRITPAIPHSAPEISHATSTIRSVRIPQPRARDESVAGCRTGTATGSYLRPQRLGEDAPQG